MTTTIDAARRASAPDATPPLPSGPYSIIYADPPWAYRDKAHAGQRGVAYKYPTMTDAEILALPVQQLAAPNCALFLWATGPRLPFALAVLEAWGFRYVSKAFTWVKTAGGATGLHWGMGHYTRANSEDVLLGVRGRLPRCSARVQQVVLARPREHSRKPAEVRERIVQLYGDLPRIELFARERVPGWEAWGPEVPAP